MLTHVFFEYVGREEQRKIREALTWNARDFGNEFASFDQCICWFFTCICSDFNMYLFRFQNAFLHITKCLLQICCRGGAGADRKIKRSLEMKCNKYLKPVLPPTNCETANPRLDKIHFAIWTSKFRNLKEYILQNVNIFNNFAELLTD